MSHQALDRFEKTVAWEDVERLVYQLIHNHVRAHGGDFEELRQQAAVWFLGALERFVPGKGRSFSSWVGLVVTRQLLEVRRLHAKKRLPMTDADPDLLPRHDHAPRLRELLLDLSEDARTIAGLVLDTPGDLRLLFWEGNAREMLDEYLDELGWPPRYRARMFRELEEALT